MSESAMRQGACAKRRLLCLVAPGHWGGARRGAAYSPWLTTVMVLTVIRLAPAQEALRNSMAGEAAVEARRLQLESSAYTVKSGDFRLLATPSLDVDWNDNVNTSKSDPQSDFIVTPLLQLNANYPITQLNLLQLNVNFGYQKYISHDQLSSWYVQSGSALSFDIFVKDFLINLHDQLSYVQDSGQEAAVAGTGQFGTINNTAGLSGTWDLNDMTLMGGYDHQNVMSTTQQFQSQDRNSELMITRAGLKLHPQVIAGVEGTAAFTTYDQPVLNDNTSYSLGVYSDWQPGSFFHLQVRGGYTIFQFQHTSTSIETSDLNAWYLGVTATHQISDGVSYSLSAGHDIRLGIESDAIDEWYVTPSINWSIIKNWTFVTSLSYQHGNQGVGNVSGNLTETYDWLTGSLALTHPITAKLTAGLHYRFTLRSSNQPDREYAQNLVGFQLSYQFQ